MKLTNKLEKVSKSAMSRAVRQTLSDTAFDVKKRTMPESAAEEFIQRKPTFFKAKSTVNPAKGGDISTMKAVVGFKGAEQAVEDMEQQEHGGNISGRTFIPLKQARAAKQWHKSVKSNLRMSALDNMKNAKNAKGKNAGERFTKSAIHAGKGGLVLGETENSRGNKTVYKINSVKRLTRMTTSKAGKTRYAGDTVVNATPVYSERKGRKAKVKATHFMMEASEKSASNMDEMYIKNATKEIARVLR